MSEKSELKRSVREERKAEKKRLREERKLLKEKKSNEAEDETLMRNSELREVAPTKGYAFNSDYFQIKDGRGSKGDAYGTILQLIVNKNVARGLPPMWGIQLFPVGTLRRMPDLDVTLLNHFQLVSKSMTKSYTKRSSEAVKQMKWNAVSGNSTETERKKSSLQAIDYDEIIEDLGNNGRYVEADFRLLLKAPSLQRLDEAVEVIHQHFEQYARGAFTWVSREGDQRTEFSHILDDPYAQNGKSYGFGSTNYAGSYNLVSHGITDSMGEYVGETKNDLASSAVVLDVDDFRGNVVVASNDMIPRRLGELRNYPINTHESALWGVKLMQQALIDGHRVVSFVLDDTQLDKIGIDLSVLTTKVQMNEGAINPLEIFGQNPLGAMAAHTEVISLMAMQLDDQITAYDRNELLSGALRNFYVHQNMWLPNAKDHADRLRVLNLPHDEYPQLHEFLVYLRKERNKAEVKGQQTDVDGYNRLIGAISKLAEDNSDLFDYKTDSSIDDSQTTPNVVYNFNELVHRSTNIAMAQLVNVFGYATNSLGRSETNPDGDGDLIIIYGADELDPSLFPFLNDQMHHLSERGVRIAFVYNNTDILLTEPHLQLTDFKSLDYLLCGRLDGKSLDVMVDALGRGSLSNALANDIQNLAEDEFFFTRGSSNIVFRSNLVLDTNTGLGTEVHD